MKNLFDEETANFLGYQKQWPELKDWMLAIAGTLGALALVFGLCFFIAFGLN